MKNRPFFQSKIEELQQIFDASHGDRAVLKKLAAELKHRQVPKAVALLAKVKKVIDAVSPARTEAPSRQETDHPTHAPTHKVVNCQSCQQRLRVELATERRRYTCPSCKTKFLVSFEDGVFSVVFSSPAGSGEEPMNRASADGAKLTLSEAYQIFGANADTSWETIEQTRRRLIQQYHPDKVAALGPKLRAVAEFEGKRINVAFNIIRKSRQL